MMKRERENEEGRGQRGIYVEERMDGEGRKKCQF